MFLDLISFDKLKRALLYTALLLGLLTLQNGVFSRVAILGTRPMFLPCFAVAVGMFSGASWGGAFGLLAGIFCDMSFLESSVLFTILLPVLGFAAGVVTQLYFNRRFFAYFFFCAAALLLCALLQCARPLLFSGTVNLSDISDQLQSSATLSIARGTDRLRVMTVALLQALWSLPFAFLVYFPCKAIGRQRSS